MMAFLGKTRVAATLPIACSRAGGKTSAERSFMCGLLTAPGEFVTSGRLLSSLTETPRRPYLVARTPGESHEKHRLPRTTGPFVHRTPGLRRPLATDLRRPRGRSGLAGAPRRLDRRRIPDRHGRGVRGVPAARRRRRAVTATPSPAALLKCLGGGVPEAD